MYRLMTGTALAAMFAVAPAMADTSPPSDTSQTVPSPTIEEKAVSQPADTADGDSATTLEDGMQAGDTSMTASGADDEPMSSVDRKAGAPGDTTLEEGQRATTAGGEVIPETGDDPLGPGES